MKLRYPWKPGLCLVSLLVLLIAVAGATGMPIPPRFRLNGKNEVGLSVDRYNPQLPLAIDPVLTWNTFLGGAAIDGATGIALDAGGNIYVIGSSWATWGKPVNGFSDNIDTFVVKLNSEGVLQWSTFLGGNDIDEAGGIAVDAAGNVYVTGASYSTWGNPLRPFTGHFGNAYVAKLKATGERVWNTFLGGDSLSSGSSVAVDGGGNVFVVGTSTSTWGAPINPHANKSDAFVARLGSLGVLAWNTFLGGDETDAGSGIVLDGQGSIYVCGSSDSAWGNATRAHSGGEDGFVARLNGNGGRMWNAFLGGRGDDNANAIAVDNSGYVYVTGQSDAGWGSPKDAFVAKWDAFVAKLSTSGLLSWNTFLGGFEDDFGYSIAADRDGNIFIGGASASSWGKPVADFAGGTDALLAKLNPSGNRVWHTFLGSAAMDSSYGIAADNNGYIYTAGTSEQGWGDPIIPLDENNGDAFVAKILDSQPCAAPAITAQPAGKTIISGGSAVLSVAVSGTEPLQYQWYEGTKGNTAKPAAGASAATSSYSTSSLDTTTDFWVRISNPCGSIDSSTVTVIVQTRGYEDLVGTWAASGTYYRNSQTGDWQSLTSAATQIAVGDMDGDGVSDLIGFWQESGIWVKYSSTGTWELLTSSAADWIASGDFNGDGKADLVRISGSTAWLRDSATGVWSLAATGATKVVADDMDGDGKADLIGTWADSGVWAKYSSTGAWALLTSSPADWISAGDISGDGKADLLGIWGTQIWWLDVRTGSWTYITDGAGQVATGDLDGDGKKDVIGVWPGENTWVRYSSTGLWERLASAADSIGAGRMH